MRCLGSTSQLKVVLAKKAKGKQPPDDAEQDVDML